MSKSTMVVETIFTKGVAHLSYLIGDRATGKAAVIDPRRDVDVYLELARKQKLSITHVLETHIHADFVSGTRELCHRMAAAVAFLSIEGGANYGFECDKLKDGDQIDLGRVILTAKHTPGHTPEHMSFLAAEGNRPEQPFAVFSGDCLFADSVGRPDLLGEDATEGLAAHLYRSLYEFYLELSDNVLVHAAHGSGSPCGANISDRLVSTIGYERRNNEALQFNDEAKFIEYVLLHAPPEPVYYPRIKKINTDGPEVLGQLPPCKPMPPHEFAAAFKNSNAQLVDNRQMFGFGGGHIAGGLNIGPRAELSIWAGWVLDPEQPILLVLADEADLSEVLWQLLRVGFSRFEGYLLGGMEQWANNALPIAKLEQMSVQELNSELPAGDLQIVDVRSPDEWQAGHLPGATYIFLPELTNKAKRLDKKRPVVTYCDSGYRASLAASILKREGFSEIHNIPGSWKAWRAAKYETENPTEQKKSSDTDR